MAISRPFYNFTNPPSLPSVSTVQPLQPKIDDCHRLLRDVFGHTEFRPSQRTAIARTLAGQHSLVLMPTGGGKSLCYQIPALVWASDYRRGSWVSPTSRPPLTIVLSPLIALMKDQVDALSGKGVAATLINSSLSGRERQRRYGAVRRGEYDLLYVTPERFRKAEFLEAIALRHIVLLAVDEAHCISQWGHDFRPDYSRLREIRQRLEEPVTLALTATATATVQRDIVQQLGLAATEVAIFSDGIARPNLTLEVADVWAEEDKLQQIEKILAATGSLPDATVSFQAAPFRTGAETGVGQAAGLVYFTLIRTLERFSELLRQRRVPHLIYHGELERRQRRSIQERFLDEPGHLVLATNAFGMGIDKADIRYVLHAELPGSLEAYYQEIGRAGRDGLPATCLLMYDSHDLETQMEFIRWSNPDVDFTARVYDFLRHDLDAINAFGLEWLRERLHAKQKHDRRLETALGLMERYDVFEGTLNPLKIVRVHDLAGELRDAEHMALKLRSDQERLLRLVQYAQAEDRREFLDAYFAADLAGDSLSS